MSGDQEPHTNGLNGGASDDEDDQKNMRPVDIEADVHEMERRKRVEAIMNSKVSRSVTRIHCFNVSIFQLFREELERVVGDSLRESGADSLAGLMSDVMNIKSGSKFQLFLHFYSLKVLSNVKCLQKHVNTGRIL